MLLTLKAAVDIVIVNIFRVRLNRGDAIFFELWVRNTRQAADAGAIFHVVTKQDGTLGHSQEGEVRFLAKSGYKFYSYAIDAYVKMWAGWAYKRAQGYREMRLPVFKPVAQVDSSLQKYERVRLSL